MLTEESQDIRICQPTGQVSSLVILFNLAKEEEQKVDPVIKPGDVMASFCAICPAEREMVFNWISPRTAVVTEGDFTVESDARDTINFPLYKIGLPKEKPIQSNVNCIDCPIGGCVIYERTNNTSVAEASFASVIGE